MPLSERAKVLHARLRRLAAGVLEAFATSGFLGPARGCHLPAAGAGFKGKVIWSWFLSSACPYEGRWRSKLVLSSVFLPHNSPKR